MTYTVEQYAVLLEATANQRLLDSKAITELRQHQAEHLQALTNSRNARTDLEQRLSASRDKVEEKLRIIRDLSIQLDQHQAALSHLINTSYSQIGTALLTDSNSIIREAAMKVAMQRKTVEST